MADQDIKEKVTPLEQKIADSAGLAPVEVHLAVELGVESKDIMAVKQTKWRQKSQQITEEQE